MSRRSVCLALVALFVPLAAFAQPSPSQVLRDVENAWVKALAQHDTAALEKILAPEFRHTTYTGAVLGRAQSLAAAKDSRSNGVENRLEDVQVRVFENRFGIVSGVNAASSPAGSARLHFTDVFVFRDGRWQAVSAQETLEVPQHPHPDMPRNHP